MNALKELQYILPDGMVVDAAWLENRGYSSSTRSRYVQQGWLQRPAPGVYRRPGQPLLWQQVVMSLQALMDFPVAVGGITALYEHKHDHYLQGGHYYGPVYLYSPNPLPRWVFQVTTNAKFWRRNSSKLWPSAPPVGQGSNGPRIVDSWDDMLLSNHFLRFPWGPWTWGMVMSTVERAAIEAMNEISGKDLNEYDNPLRCTETLHRLQVGRVQNLLETCKSKKAKRLFLWMAEYNDLRFRDDLDVSHIDLGTSEMSMVPPGRKGRYCPTWHLSVAEDLYRDRETMNVF